MVRAVYSADAILIGGYGFSDIHVSQTLSNRLRHNQNRVPLIILDWSCPARGEPMKFREDRWSRDVCRFLHVPSRDFVEPGHTSPPDISSLIRRKGFEVCASQEVAIWHGGFISAHERADDMIRWLDHSASDEVLAGIA